MKKTIVTLVIGLVLLGGSLMLLMSRIHATTSSEITFPPIVSSNKPKEGTPSVTRIEGTPVKIELPSIGVSLNVAPGEYNAKTRSWSITTTKAHYATLTSKPNNIDGNTLIYGHYRSNVFAPLRKLKAADSAIITTDNGRVFHYRLSSVEVVKPTDSDRVLAYTEKPTLTLQTCTGLFYEKRQLFFFDLEKVV